jgi:hypothetical protein
MGLGSVGKRRVGFGMAGLTTGRRQRACLLCFLASREIQWGPRALIKGRFVLVDEKLRGSEAGENEGLLFIEFLNDSVSKLSNDRARSKRYIISSGSLVRLISSRVQEPEPNERRRRRHRGGLLLLWVGCLLLF